MLSTELLTVGVILSMTWRSYAWSKVILTNVIEGMYYAKGYGI